MVSFHVTLDNFWHAKIEIILCQNRSIWKPNIEFNYSCFIFIFFIFISFLFSPPIYYWHHMSECWHDTEMISKTKASAQLNFEPWFTLSFHENLSFGYFREPHNFLCNNNNQEQLSLISLSHVRIGQPGFHMISVNVEGCHCVTVYFKFTPLLHTQSPSCKFLHLQQSSNQHF